MKSAEQGNANAQYNVGFMFSHGQGVPPDPKRAIEWYIKAAEQGLVDAQYNLGSTYWKGEGTPRDYVYAYAWLSIAAAQGDSDSEKNRTRLANLMTSIQIEQALKLTVTLQNKIKPQTAKDIQSARKKFIDSLPDAANEISKNLPVSLTRKQGLIPL